MTRPLPVLGHLLQHGVIVITVIIIHLVMSVTAASPGCKVDTCSETYSQSLRWEGVRRGPTRPYCVILNTYSQCLRTNGRGCRGNLKYHTMSSLVMQWNKEYNCSHIFKSHQATSSPTHTPSRPRPTPLGVCSYKGRRSYTFCELFGDPHLRTFDGDFQTCRVLGAWPLIDNAYLAVQVTNSPVADTAHASATSKVTVIVKENEPCSGEKTFEAAVDNVPSAFVDGSQSSGGPGHSVRIVSSDPGRHVQIYIRYINTTIVVRQVGRFLTFAIHLPEDIAYRGAASRSRSGLELCRTCPDREKLSYRRTLSRTRPALKNSVSSVTMPVLTRDTATELCRKYKVTDFFLDACVFDLLTTGDMSFLTAAADAQKDMSQLFPDGAASLENRTTLRDSDASGCSREVAPASFGVVLLTSLLVLLLVPR